MAKVTLTDDQYMNATQKFISEKLKQFEEAGGWEVVSENAQHCTYHRYLEAGIRDCENAAELIKSLMVTLQAVKIEMQSQVKLLEARQSERTSFIKMVEIIDSAAKKAENICEDCARNTKNDDKEIEEGSHFSSSPSSPRVNVALASGHQATAIVSANQIAAFTQAQRKPTKTFVEKWYRPPASLTGSFTVDQDEETVLFLEPMPILTFHDTTVLDSTPKAKDNLDTSIDSSEKKSVEPAHISEPPIMKSELAKQWIREVARKMF
uniref:Uncharacterized protein n=1 Tax=Setaria digitata TaxID=48799 RepID=A0A915Q7E7_9BILA